jgi:NAD(P)-dependent dehydrogenase (short-subunit alcohol dehydrogenase family)
MKKVALITGVASGIGAATAKLFALEGWYVIGVDRCRLRNMKNVREYVEADVSQVDTWKKIGSHVEKNSGRLDALVNNAAFQLCRPIIETSCCCC